MQRWQSVDLRAKHGLWELSYPELVAALPHLNNHGAPKCARHFES